MRVIGIESSCDETAVAVVENGTDVIAEFVYSQVEHSRFGGIVPEIASRQQIRKIAPLFDACKRQVQLAPDSIDGIAVTYAPGLIGSLLVGVNFAKALSYGWEIPFIGINHLEGHIFANCLADPALKPPFLSLIVSGGHTLLIKVEDWCNYQTLGSTRDDAAGEAFDKVAKLLGLGYPGGYLIDQLAIEGDPDFHKFPQARFKTNGYQFSFSGLKTAVALYLRDKDDKFKAYHLADICASFQRAVVSMLVEQTLRAANDLELSTITLGGGVAANQGLRKAFREKESEGNFKFLFPEIKYCTDNAAMIAAAGYYRLTRGEKSNYTLTAIPYLKLI